jgi:hypothetical protein
MNTFNKKFFFISIAFLGCKTTSKTFVTKVGSDRDKHGCIHSAGYIWSEINKTCLRSFELKNQLYNADKTFIASINVSNDGEKAEVFSKEGYFLMTKKNDSTYVHPKAILNLGKNNWIFSDKKNRIYYENFKQSLIHNP